MSDPLSLLRAHILSQDPIELTDNSGNKKDIQEFTHFKFNNVLLPRNAPTNYKSRRSTKDLYSLDSCYFLHASRDLSQKEYIKECTQVGIAVINLLDKKDLLQYLMGGESTQIDFSLALRTEEIKIETEPRTEEEWMTLIRGMEVPINGDYVFSSNHSFADVLSIIKNQKATRDLINNPTSSLVGIQTERKNKELTPIIIVPSSSTSILNLTNISEFIEKDSFVPGSKSIGTDLEVFKNDKKFQIIDNPSKLKDADWDRVICIIVQGNSWQFKGWKWEDPVEIFSRILGIHIVFDDDTKPPLPWNVKRVVISKNKRYMDKTASIQFWDFIQKRRIK